MLSAKRLSSIINHSRDFVTLINRDYVYEFANEAYCTSIDKPQNAVVDHTVAEVWSDDRFIRFIKPNIDRCLAGETVEMVDTFHFGNLERTMHVVYYPFVSGKKLVTHAMVFSHDITRISEIESKLNNYEYLDPMTGLFNRRSLSVILERELLRHQRGGANLPGALLFIMLKNFKQINQLHGHHIGDLLLENTGIRAKQVVRSSDYVFRFEGTNLVVLLPELKTDTDAAIVAQKIYETIALPYRFVDIDITVDCHVGVSVFPEDSTDSIQVLHCANSAVVEAESQDLPFLLYDKTTHERAIERVTLKTGLQRAFEKNELELFYQPIVYVDGTIAGAEALIRWNHPQRGLLGPASFLAMAEETRLISPIDKLALYMVCSQLSRWAQYPDLFVTMNISAVDLIDNQLTGIVEQALRDSGEVDPRRLKLELTESKSVQTLGVNTQILSRLNDINVEIWVDDFGTGHSSLSALSRYPIRTVKIDKDFIRDIGEKPADTEYLSGIVQSIRALGKGVVVEGISSPEQYDQISGMNVSYLQGFYFSRPVPAHEFEALLERDTLLP